MIDIKDVIRSLPESKFGKIDKDLLDTVDQIRISKGKYLVITGQNTYYWKPKKQSFR